MSKMVMSTSVLGFFGTISAIGYYVFPLMSTGQTVLWTDLLHKMESACVVILRCAYGNAGFTRAENEFSFSTCYDNLKEISGESL